MDGSDWLADYGYVEDETVVVADDFLYPSSGFSCWSPPPPPPFDCSSDESVEVNYFFGESEISKGSGCRKRLKSESFNGSSGTKACREKIRRDRLNERFLELGSVLEPGRPPPSPRMDKAVILNDAVRTVIHLRDETDKLKKSIGHLEEKIKELKAEKNELRDEKQKLKADKEKMEQQLKAMSIQQQQSFLQPHPSAMSAAAAFAAQGGRVPAGNKLMPYISYPSIAMWQYLPQSVVDTSQDHILRPPVA